jgi:hypothetical protein
MDELLTRLKTDYPSLAFRRGPTFSWSAQTQTVILPRASSGAAHPEWSLLHEMGHATLNHQNYSSDLELVRLEAAAWQQAVKLGRHYQVRIDPDHIEDCLDSYRDWLHQRSTCPVCATVSLQLNQSTYRCYNCQASWGVSRSRLCRPYRRLATTKQKAPA